MQELFTIYNQFLGYFPSGWEWLVSVVLAGLLVFAVYKTVTKNFIYLILLVVLLPASAPILKNIWESVVFLIKFLLTRR